MSNTQLKSSMTKEERIEELEAILQLAISN
jgi:hypothetical protein